MEYIIICANPFHDSRAILISDALPLSIEPEIETCSKEIR